MTVSENAQLINVIYYKVWVCTRLKKLSEEDEEKKAEYQAGRFKKAKKGQVERKVLGDQKVHDAVGDGIPMAISSIVELFKLANIGRKDFVLECGYGSYPRLAVYAAIVTGNPVIAFDPFSYQSFTDSMKALHGNSNALVWKFPNVEADSEPSTEKRKKRACTEARRDKNKK
jgi:hypothetical protein